MIEIAENALTGLCREVASARASSIAATLASGGALEPAALDWIRSAFRSLTGVVTQIDDPALLAEVNAIGREADTLDGAANTAASDVAAQLMAFSKRLQPSAMETAAVAFGDLAILARSEVERAAKANNVTVLIDVPPHAEGHLPRPIAAMLVDVLGQVVRGAVRYGIPTGGAMRIAFESPTDAFVVVVSDRADRAGRDQAALAAERAAMLRTSEARVAAVGGELTSGGGPWGGTSVTIRIPLGRNAKRKTWTQHR